MHFSILALFTLLPSLALNTLASPAGTDGCQAEICHRTLEPRAPLTLGAIPTPTSPRTSPRLTNARRLALGLPIKPPRRRGSIGSRSAFARPSAVPMVNYRGVIEVTNTANGQILGYISKSSLNFAQYRYQPALDDALIVSFSIDSGVTAVNDVRITSENSDTPGFPLLSLVQGRDDTSVDFAQGSFQYGYIAGMAEPGSGPDSVPVTSPSNSYTAATSRTRAAISDVWAFQVSTMALAPQWVNSDGSKPTIYSFTQSTALYVGGDQAAFTARYPAPVTPIAFTFIPL